jgi:D-glycero-alpha-D-manno-heptose-7-phosphate kinase
MILYYTGVSRESARIISEEQALMRGHDASQLAALHALRDEAWRMKEHILRGELARFAQSMQRGWEAKKHIASAITTPAIEQAIAVGTDAGAYAAKVSGAGGGGFVMMFADPEDRGRVGAALEALRAGAIRPCHFTKYGAQAWRVD